MRSVGITLMLTAGLALCACSDAGDAAASSTEGLSTADRPETADSIAQDSYHEFGRAIAHHQRLTARVARISRRLRVANAPLCDLTRGDIGLSTHRLADYPEPLHPLAIHFMDIDDEGRFIRGLVPGSPASMAGLRVGDQILDGWPVQAPQAASAPQTVIVQGPNGALAVPVAPDRACHIPTFVVQTEQLNAATDGQEIDLSTALIEAVGDDDALALIIAHEMAHVIRGHTQQSAGWQAEIRADTDALVLMRNAGFDIEGTVAGWAAGIEAHRESQAMSATHPPVDIRLRNLETQLAALMTRPAGFLPLEDE